MPKCRAQNTNSQDSHHPKRIQFLSRLTTRLHHWCHRQTLGITRPHVQNAYLNPLAPPHRPGEFLPVTLPLLPWDSAPPRLDHIRWCSWTSPRPAMPWRRNDILLRSREDSWRCSVRNLAPDGLSDRSSRPAPFSSISIHNGGRQLPAICDQKTEGRSAAMAEAKAPRASKQSTVWSDCTTHPNLRLGLDSFHQMYVSRCF